MERIFHKVAGFLEAEQWDIKQQLEMTPEFMCSTFSGKSYF